MTNTYSLWGFICWNNFKEAILTTFYSNFILHGVDIGSLSRIVFSTIRTFDKLTFRFSIYSHLTLIEDFMKLICDFILFNHPSPWTLLFLFLQCVCVLPLWTLSQYCWPWSACDALHNLVNTEASEGLWLRNEAIIYNLLQKYVAIF